MSVIATAVRALLAAGVTGEDLVAVIAQMEAEQNAARQPQRTARQERNSRYYQARKERLKASESVLNQTSQTLQDASQTDGSQDKNLPHTPYKNPTLTSSSEPEGSSSEAAAAATDPRTELFRRGLSVTRTMTGRSLDQCRSLVGKWLKLAADDAVMVLAAIDEASRQELANPVPWIGMAIKREAAEHRQSYTPETPRAPGRGDGAATLLRREVELERAERDRAAGAADAGSHRARSPNGSRPPFGSRFDLDGDDLEPSRSASDRSPAEGNLLRLRSFR